MAPSSPAKETNTAPPPTSARIHPTFPQIPRHPSHFYREPEIPLRIIRHEPIDHGKTIGEHAPRQVALRHDSEIRAVHGLFVFVTKPRDIVIWGYGIANRLGTSVVGGVVVSPFYRLVYPMLDTVVNVHCEAEGEEHVCVGDVEVKGCWRGWVAGMTLEWTKCVCADYFTRE